jgi:hypothetical protein
MYLVSGMRRAATDATTGRRHGASWRTSTASASSQPLTVPSSAGCVRVNNGSSRSVTRFSRSSWKAT